MQNGPILDFRSQHKILNSTDCKITLIPKSFIDLGLHFKCINRKLKYYFKFAHTCYLFYLKLTPCTAINQNLVQNFQVCNIVTTSGSKFNSKKSVDLCYFKTGVGFIGALNHWFLTLGYSGVLDCNSQKPSPPTVLAGVSGSCSSKTSK